MVDEAVVRRLIEYAGGKPNTVHVANGKAHLRQKIDAYNHAAEYAPWIVLVDLDNEECAPALRQSWLPTASRLMSFRVAVREIESWLLADRPRIAEFLGLSVAKVPLAPDSLDDPKRTLVDLSRRSRRRDIREDMIPRPGSGRSEGPAYSSRIIEFVRTHWRPSLAINHSTSLRSCCTAIEAIVERERRS
jgi:hypothetical protein